MKRKGMGKGTGKGYKNMTGVDPKVHSDSARGRKQPQRISNLPNLTKSLTPFNYQDTNQEKVIHSGWEKGNNFRYVLEGTGDIFRELTKPKEFQHFSYISEKTTRIKKHIKQERDWVHEEDSFETSRRENQDKFQRMIEQWKVQPTNTSIQKKAVELNIAMLQGNWSKSLNLVKDIESEFEKRRRYVRR